MREVFTEQALTTTFTNCPKELMDGYKEYMGMTLSWGGQVVDNRIKVSFLLISGIIFVLISALIQKRRNTVYR